MRKSIAVIYLARSESGSAQEFLRFAKSYRRFSAGVPHDLLIIHKGAARKAGTRSAIAQCFDGIPFTSIDRDDAGFDIQAYLAAAKQASHEYVCFLNTYSEIRANDWLAKLVQPLLDSSHVGMTGATGSYESLHSSFGLYSKVIWMCATGVIGFDQRIAKEFSPQLSLHAPSWLTSASSGATNLPWSSIDNSSIRDGFLAHWSAVTRVGAGLYGLNQFKPFPNPHLRSNAFAMQRDFLISLDFDLGDTKIECVRFESGLDGLPTRIAQRGRESVLVGADGQSFTTERWFESNGFRLGDQANVLVTDNQVRVFDGAGPEHRQHLSRLSWGEYAGLQTELYERLGFPHVKGNLLLSHANRHLAATAQRPLRISIVIPTRNRQALVKDALHTVIGQEYPHWECIVFDNCSDEPLAADIAAFADERIRYVRSDTFLPVTESWNRAIDEAMGDYITLLGDDDGLTPDFMSSIEFIVRHHANPDFVYTSFLQFFHPGVAPWQLAGYVADVRYGAFFANQDDIFKIDPGAAEQAVAGSLGFRRNFAFNMQSFCFSKSFLDSVRQHEKVFHSPFPDYYLANVAMGFGKSIVVAPKPLTVAGVSKKSFGFTLFNDMEAQGAALLATDLLKDPMYETVKSLILPGPAYNTNFFVTMQHVKARLGDFTSQEVDVGRYRRLQIMVNMFPNSQPQEVKLQASFLDRLDPFERKWVDELSELSGRAQQGDSEATSELSALQQSTAMHGQPAKSRDLDVGSFAYLPELFSALRNGEIRISQRAL